MEEEKPKKRTITVEVEDQEDGRAVRVIPSFKDSFSVLRDLSMALGSTVGYSTTSLEGIKVITEEMGEVILRSAIGTYETLHGKPALVAEAFMALLGIKQVDMAKKLPPDLLEAFNKKCKSCDKESCPLHGKGVTDSTGEVKPECLH